MGEHVIQGGRSKVLLVEDDVQVGRFWQQVLESRFDVEWVANAEAAEQVLERSDDFDAVLTDLCLPGKSGLELLQVVKAQYPDSARLIITGNADLDSAMAAINDAKASAYLTKPCTAQTLLHTVQQAIEEAQGAALDELERLSPRERDMVKALRAGLAPKQIALDYKISEHTVRNHIKSVYRKLGVHSQLELISKLTRH